MTPRAIVDLLVLAALWGGSFIFLRSSVSEFGPIGLATARIVVSASILLPIVALRGQGSELRGRWKHLIVCGALSYGIPFALIAYALLSLSAGLSSIFNASSPLWGALVAWVWLGDRLSGSRLAGLLIGFAGVFWLAFSKAGAPLDGTTPANPWAIAAILSATLCYAVGVSYTRRFLTGVPSMAVAAGSQVGGAIVLAVPAMLTWPAATPSHSAWITMLALAALCTALAYTIFYRLIGSIGSTNALSVTFLVPAFAVLWGWLAFCEQLTHQMVLGCLIIFSGTILAVGIVKIR